jgi:hypothetical protein
LHIYRLVEFDDYGHRSTEEFRAPDDAEALSRVREAMETQVAELWRGPILVRRLVAPAADGGSPAAGRDVRGG